MEFHKRVYGKFCVSKMTENCENQPARFEFLHLLRGIAPLLVMWAHLADWWPTAHGIHWAGQEVWLKYIVNPLRLYQFGGHLGVVIFFLISGFVITHVSQREDRRTFFVRRFFRLAPMLVFAIILTALLAKMSEYYSLPKPIGTETTKPIDIILNITLISWFIGSPWVLSVIWTLFIEVVYYFAVFAAIPIRENDIKSTVVVFILCIMAIIPIQIIFNADQYLDRIIYLPFLVFGRCLYFFKKNPSWTWLLLSILSLLTFFGVHIMRFGNALLYSEYPPMTSYFIAIIIFIALMYLPIKSTPQPFKWMADISYSTYLVHLPVGSILLGILTNSGMQFFFSFPITIGACLLTATITWLCIELPMQNLGKSLTK